MSKNFLRTVKISLAVFSEALKEPCYDDIALFRVNFVKPLLDAFTY